MNPFDAVTLELNRKNIAQENEIATLKQQLAEAKTNFEATELRLGGYIAECDQLKQQNDELLSALRTCKSSTKYNLQEELVTTYYFDIKKVIDAIASAEVSP